MVEKRWPHENSNENLDDTRTMQFLCVSYRIFDFAASIKRARWRDKSCVSAEVDPKIRRTSRGFVARKVNLGDVNSAQFADFESKVFSQGLRTGANLSVV
jgi:hypothetical protein